MRVMRLVFEKKTFFSNNVYSGKKLFLKIWFFSSVFFYKIFFKCIYFTFESCLSLIRGIRLSILLKNKDQNVKKKKKKTVFMINIHNLPQFINHTVALVENKNNNERISLK